MTRRLDWLLPSWLEDSNAYDQSMDEDMTTVYYTIAFNVVIFACCILFFSFYRMREPAIFTPKADLMPSKTPPLLPNDTMFGWIWTLYDIDDHTIENSGCDCLFFIRFYRFAFKIFFFFSFYAWGVLLWINGTGGSNADSNSFEVWSMTNISQGSDRCWFHLIGIYILTGITIYFLEKEFVFYAKHRHMYLRQRHAHLRTVLVEGIPNQLRSTVTLGTYFETMYPNAVLSVRCGQDTQYLDRLIEQRLDAVTKLERYLYMNHYNKVRPLVYVGNMMDQVDAIRYYSQLLDDLNEAVRKEQEVANQLAVQSDNLSGQTAYEVIEKFLHVTEIGSVRKLLKEKTGRVDKWFRRLRSNNPETNGNTGVGIDTSDSENNVALSHMNDSENEVFRDAPGNSSKSSLKKRKNYGIVNIGGNSYGSTDDVAPSEKESLSSRYQSPPEERRMFLSKAFVTFKTFTAATIARQVVHMQLAGHLAVSEAPQPSDITWSNMYATRTQLFYRRLFVETMVLLLIIVWVAPVTLMSFVLSEDALRSEFPFIDKLCHKSEIFKSGIELIQPGALVSLMMLLPPILTALAVLEGCISFSSNQFRSFDRYFTFQIINVFLVTTIAGSVINCIKEIYYDPGNVFYLLGNSLPKMGGYFMNYIIMKAFIGLGMEIIRLPAMCAALAKFLFTPNTTPRDKRATPMFGGFRAMSNPGWFNFAKVYAQDTLLVIVCATYACIAPLILAAGLCYFGLASYIYKHQMLYVYEPAFETGGKWWPKMARCIVLALLFAQCTMVGMMILKETYTEIYFLGLIIVSTTIYSYYVASKYEPIAAQLPFDMAMAMDLDQQHSEDDLAGVEGYIQPSLRAHYLIPEVDFVVSKQEEV